MALSRLTNIGSSEIVTGNLAATNESVGSTVDAQIYQSVSVQVSGTWAGTITFQVSNDGSNYVSRAMVPVSAGSPVATTTANGVWSADFGARYFRVLFSARTSGTAIVTVMFNAFSLSNNVSTQAVSGTVATTPNQVEQTESSTNLAANATYTGASRDMGTSVAARRTLLRPVIMHNAGTAPGSLVLQESTDGTTWRETRRSPIPSDGSYRSFEWPLHLRYYRLVFTNGATAQTGFFLQSVATQGEGGTMDAKNNISFLLSATALGANATYTGPTLDLGDNHIWDRVRARAYLATASTTARIRVESSHDGTTWGFAEEATATTAGILTLERNVTERYIRLVVVNGATAQTSNALSLALVSL